MWLARMVITAALLAYGVGITHAQMLNIGTAEWHPWQIQGNNQLTGITPEVLQEVSRRTGIAMNVVLLPHRRLMDGFKLGCIDMEPTVNPAWREDQREISVYTAPFFATNDIILVRKESGIRGTCARDFRGLTLGCGLGYYYPEGFQAAFERGDITRDDNPAAGNNLKKLLHQRIDGAILDKQQAAFMLKTFGMNPDAFAVAYEFQPSNLCLRLHMRRQALLPVLNAAIESMIADGTVDRIATKYTE